MECILRISAIKNNRICFHHEFKQIMHIQVVAYAYIMRPNSLICVYHAYKQSHVLYLQSVFYFLLQTVAQQSLKQTPCVYFACVYFAFASIYVNHPGRYPLTSSIISSGPSIIFSTNTCNHCGTPCTLSFEVEE